MARIDLLILDVDGVLTDGRVQPAPDGDAPKAFCVHDGCAIKLWQRCDGKVAIISGRKAKTVILRAEELGIECVHTGVSDKLSAFKAVLASLDRPEDSAAYVGDDLPDLEPMGRCGFPVAVANAVPTVKRAAEFVTRRPGGSGAVAEVIELLLRKKKMWDSAAFEAV